MTLFEGLSWATTVGSAVLMGFTLYRLRHPRVVPPITRLSPPTIVLEGEQTTIPTAGWGEPPIRRILQVRHAEGTTVYFLRDSQGWAIRYVIVPAGYAFDETTGTTVRMDQLDRPA